jgi:hypothetical protein
MIEVLIDSGAHSTLGPSAVDYSGLRTIARILLNTDTDIVQEMALNDALSRGNVELADPLLIERSRTGPCNSKLLGSAVLSAARHGLSTLKYIVEKWKANSSWSGGCEG